MSYMVNLETAKSIERGVRVSESTPATIRLIDGRVTIGLELHELERSAECKPVKLSRRYVHTVIMLKRDGGTACGH